MSAPPATITPLPPCAREANPVENSRAFQRSNTLGSHVFASDDAIGNARCDAWNRLATRPERIAAIASRAWAEVTFRRRAPQRATKRESSPRSRSAAGLWPSPNRTICRAAMSRP